MTARRKKHPADKLVASIARDLRRSQRDKGIVPRRVLDQISNEQLCWSYLTCCECKTPLVDSLRSLVRKVRTSDRFVAVANALLDLHHVEYHGRRVYHDDPHVGGEALTAGDLRTRLQLILDGVDLPETVILSDPTGSDDDCDHPTVWDQALNWAEEHFHRLEGRACSHDELVAACERHVRLFPGIETKKWLFVYSPASASNFFEVSDDQIRMMMACAKLGTVAEEGGMLLGADFSVNWGKPRSVGKFVPFLVCKPSGSSGGDELPTTSD